MCERCGTNCFCAAEAGVLPRTRGAAKNEAVTAAANGHAFVLADGLAAIMQYDSD